jgi:Single cache domain 3
VDILGKPYITGYDPIHDASGAVIGIYYVGYMKS